MLGSMASSTAAIMIRFAQQDSPSLVIAAWRLGLATLILMPLVLSRHRIELSSLKRQDIRLLALSGIFLAAHFAAWISSLQYTSVASAVVLVNTNPLWVALFSWLLLGEKPTRRVAAGMLVALAGGAVIGLNDAAGGDSFGFASGTHTLWGDLLALLGALFGAGYIIIGRKLRAFTSLPVYTFSVYGFAALLLMVAVVVTGQPLTGYQPATYLWFLLLAVIPQLLGHSSINWGLKYLPAAFVAVVMLSEPIGSSLLAVLILKETPTIVMMIGGVLILIGIGIASSAGSGKTAGELSAGD
jgi:drug/metabolite transporter (DMT)-like permease